MITENNSVQHFENTATEIPQSWSVARHADLPLFSVIFVRDLTGGRVEAWLHMGAPITKAWNDPVPDVAKFRLGAYTATLLDGDKTIHTGRAPHHAINRCWRLGPGPRALVNDAAKVKQSGLVPDYNAQATNGKALSSFGSAYRPMALAGVAPKMGGTGERDDIGPVTECQAQWLATGAKAAYDQMIAQAEACGTVPWVIIDDATMKPVDVIANPGANTNWPGAQGGTPWYATDAGPDNIQAEYAHHPNLWFVPYLATKDPYYLWLGQAQTVAAILMDNPGYRSRPGDVCHKQDNQTRAVAWRLRDIIYATTVAPTSPTGGFLSKAWFDKVLENNRLAMEDNTIRSSHTQAKAFHVGPVLDYAGAADNGVAPWQQDMLTFVVGRAVASGFTAWKPLHDWLVEFAIARTSEGTGWDRRFPAVYSLPFAANPTTHAQLFAAAVKQNSLPGTISGPLWYDKDNGWSYTTYLRAVLVQAGKLGNAKAAANGTWLASALKNSRAKSDYKWAV